MEWPPVPASYLIGRGAKNAQVKLKRKFQFRENQRSKLKLVTIDISTVNWKEKEVIEAMKERGLTVKGVCEALIEGKCNKLIHQIIS